MKAELKYPLWLALIAAVILGGGLVLKPAQKKVEAISESERARLLEMTQKKNLQDMGRYFAVLADRIADRVVRLSGKGASGVMAGQDGMIVSSLRSASIWTPFQVAGEFGSKPALVTAAAPDHPVVALHAPSAPQLNPAPIAPVDGVSPGAWLVLLAREESGARFFIPGVYSGSNKGGCGADPFLEISTNLPLNAATLGAGIFDIDGALVAIVVYCGERYAAMAAGEIEAQLRAAQGLSAEVYLRYGMAVSPLDDAGSKYFKALAGVLVRSVWRDGQASASGLRPGDILTSLNKKPVRSLDDLAVSGFTQLGRSFEMTVARGGRERKVVLPAPSADSTTSSFASSLGLTVYSPASGIQVDSVTPGSLVAKAGIQPGDRLIEIDGRTPSSPEAVRRALVSAKPRFLIVQRGPSELGVLLPVD